MGLAQDAEHQSVAIPGEKRAENVFGLHGLLSGFLG